MLKFSRYLQYLQSQELNYIQLSSCNHVAGDVKQKLHVCRLTVLYFMDVTLQRGERGPEPEPEPESLLSGRGKVFISPSPRGNFWDNVRTQRHV